MSKIGAVRLDLDEQAEKLGFESLEMAQNAGCEVEWHGNSAELVEPLEAAHRAWEKEKKEVLEELENLHDYFVEEDDLHYSIVVAKAIKFIEEAHE